jgi:hypothetical protein
LTVIVGDSIEVKDMRTGDQQPATGLAEAADMVKAAMG